MSKLIEAGPGKIKKKRKTKALYTVQDWWAGLFNPFENLEEYYDNINNTKKTEEKGFSSDYFKNLEYFEPLSLNRVWMISLARIGKFCEGSDFHDSPIKLIVNRLIGHEYCFSNIPSHPSIELMQISVPDVDNKMKIPKMNSTFQKSLEHYVQNPKLTKIWKALHEWGPGRFNMQIYFKSDKKSKIIEGLYIPLMKGDPRIPEHNKGNLWHIFYVKFMRKKAEIYYHDNGALVTNCPKARKRGPYCNPDQHFFHSLGDAIIKYGGRK